ncbi:hypothetical protein Ahy_A04g018189 isoform F [Arachis hypogaea]|uniref:Uncharacterized protein n=1 Tax=Arachis hypogaea TaxID=3818 RepID=A0A445DD63_ARAHY|nr:hypothetical protein Ahy_A04g018189 isoform F [Arachis hypogaea]
MSRITVSHGLSIVTKPTEKLRGVVGYGFPASYLMTYIDLVWYTNGELIYKWGAHMLTWRSYVESGSSFA